jgi:hypothetical protein
MGDTVDTWEDNIKVNHKEIDVKMLSGFTFHTTVAGPCERSNELSCCIEGGEFLD